MTFGRVHASGRNLVVCILDWLRQCVPQGIKLPLLRPVSKVGLLSRLLMNRATLPEDASNVINSGSINHCRNSNARWSFSNGNNTLWTWKTSWIWETCLLRKCLSTWLDWLSTSLPHFCFFDEWHSLKNLGQDVWLMNHGAAGTLGISRIKAWPLSIHGLIFWSSCVGKHLLHMDTKRYLREKPKVCVWALSP